MSTAEEHIQFDRQKFLDVVHFICHLCRQNPAELGKVKLHKALYFADMVTYLETGRPLTGVEYQKQTFGPVARHLAWALDELQKSGRLRVEERNYFGYPKLDFISAAKPGKERLTEHDRKLLGDIVDFVCAKSAREISEFSHNEAWRLAKLGERIPYYSALALVPSEVTDADREWADREAQRHGLMG